MRESDDATAQTQVERDFQRALMRFKHTRYIPTPVSDALTPAEAHVIMGIGRFADSGERPRPRDIGRILHLSASALSQTLGSLEKKGYITRERGECDARHVEIGLTQTGRAYVDAEIDRFHTSMREMRDYLGEDDLREFARILNKVYTFYEAQVAAGAMMQYPAHGPQGSSGCCRPAGEEA